MDLDQKKYSSDGKRICQRCADQAIAASVKSPRFLPIPALPPAIPTQEPPRAGAMRTVGKLVSVLGLLIIVFTVFAYMPQYEYWLVLLATAALFVIFRPWQTLPRSKCEHDRVFMGAGSGGWVWVEKDSWRPVWTCESCGNRAIEQTAPGQMLPCRNCGHENESFGPRLWLGETPDKIGWFGDKLGVIVSDEVMRARQAPADQKKVGT